MDPTHNGAGEQHEEVATEMESYDLTAMPIPQAPCEEQLKWSGMKLHLTKRDEGGFGFIFLLSYSIIKCQTKSGLPSYFLLTHQHFYVFPNPADGRVNTQPCGHLELGKVNPPQQKSQQGEKKKSK